MEVRKSSRTTSLDHSWCWVRHPYRLPVGILIARHTYLGAHRRCHSRWGVLFWSSCLRRMRREEMDSALNDSLLIFGGLVILLAPLALALADIYYILRVGNSATPNTFRMRLERLPMSFLRTV